MDRPIIFSAAMVRALIDGRKTQTRRIIPHDGSGWYRHPTGEIIGCMGNPPPRLRYAPGDRLWVRETWTDASSEGGPVILYRANNDRRYLTDESYPVDYEQYPIRGRGAWARWAPDVEAEIPGCGGYRSPIHMPRWASRLTLTVTDVRVQRLHEITEADAVAEGCPCQTGEELAGMEARGWFRDLWDSIHGSGAWARNDWVAAVSFSVERRNIDAHIDKESRHD